MEEVDEAFKEEVKRLYGVFLDNLSTGVDDPEEKLIFALRIAKEACNRMKRVINQLEVTVKEN